MPPSSSHRSRRRLISLLLAALATTLVPAAPAAAGPAPTGGRAAPQTAQHAFVPRQVEFAVRLSPADPADYRLRGTLTGPATATAPLVQVLLPGATYDRSYWDWQQQPDRYSYVTAAARAGVATLALDRLGTGSSSRPPADRVTLDTNAYTVHQVISQLRRGSQALPRFRKVQAVAHSLGSAVAIREAALYDDVDGLVLTGFTHTFGPGAPSFAPAIHPAAQDPRLAGQDLPAGYLTSRPGARELFYYRPTTAPEVLARDEATKSTTTAAEAAGLVEVAADRDLSRTLRVPVLTVVGSQDALFLDPANPKAAVRDEHDAFNARSHLQVRVIPDAGHDLNLHRNAPRTYAAILAWTKHSVRTGHRPRAVTSAGHRLVPQAATARLREP